jgi:hypothetical protein
MISSNALVLVQKCSQLMIASYPLLREASNADFGNGRSELSRSLLIFLQENLTRQGAKNLVLDNWFQRGKIKYENFWVQRVATAGMKSFCWFTKW